MNSQKNSEKSEIWLKYCEDCIRSKIEDVSRTKMSDQIAPKDCSDV